MVGRCTDTNKIILLINNKFNEEELDIGLSKYNNLRFEMVLFQGSTGSK